MKIVSTCFFIFLFLSGIAQCPSFSETSSNGKCTRLEWEVAPAEYPASITINAEIYTRVSNNSNPAIYVKDSTNGNGCNNYNNFSGDILTEDALCTYVNGLLAGESPLPVSLTDFNGVEKDGQAFLTWATASEKNNRGFLIEKSLDGIQWFELGWVAGAGTTTVQQRYSFTDSKLAVGNNYYRLKQLDYDGSFDYSLVISILRREGGVPILNIFPNPAGESLNFSFSGNEEEVDIFIYDVLGNKVFHSDHFQENIDVSDLQNGTYCLVVATFKETRVERLVIQK